MGFREIVQQNQPIVAVVAVIVIIGSVVWMANGGKNSSLPKQVYFYDVGSGELFAADRAAQPPIEAPSGAGNGVKAVVYSCGECSDSSLQVAFVTTYSEEARAAMQKMANAADGGVDVELAEVIDNGTLVAMPAEGGGEPQWVSAVTQEGIQIMGRAGDICGSQPAKPCFPD